MKIALRKFHADSQGTQKEIEAIIKINENEINTEQKFIRIS